MRPAFVAILFAFATCSPDICGPRSIITGTGLGGLRVGATVSEIGRVCEVVDDYTGLGAEGMMERKIIVDFETAQVPAVVVDDRVWRIHVTNDVFRTADSIGVGTPVTRLLQIPGIRGAEGEGRLFVVSPERCGLSFSLSYIPRGGEHRGVWDLAPLRTLPEETVVDEVLIFGCQDQPGISTTASARAPAATPSTHSGSRRRSVSRGGSG